MAEKKPEKKPAQTPAKKPNPYTMRAATPAERVRDAVLRQLDTAVQQPAVRLLDLLGFGAGEAVATANDPPPDIRLNPNRTEPSIGTDPIRGAEQRMAMMPDLPGKAAAALKAAEAAPAKRTIVAYHGSPHDFDRFSLEKIGTGEGAQAYGHGLYLTETPDVARGYRDSVGAAHAGGARTYDAEMKIGKARVEDVYRQIDEKAARMPIERAQQEYDKLSVLERLMQDGDVRAVREASETGALSPEAVAWFDKEIAPKFTRKGRMYEVEIKADPDEFLDWDAPLSEQPEKVRQAFERAYGRSLDGVAPWARGEHGYKMIDGGRMAAGVADASAANRLREAGIPGIKYLDGSSRAAGEGSRNYVVFDDSLIDIRKKWAAILAALGGGTAIGDLLRQRDQTNPYQR